LGPQRLRLVFAGNAIQHGLGVRADSGIKTWADLKGKKVAIAPGLLSMTIPGFLAYGGLTMDDVVLVRASGFKAHVKLVTEGKADAAHAPPMTPLVKQWEAAPYGLRLLPMNPNDKEAWARMARFAPFMAAPIWTETGALGEGGPKWLAYYPYTMSAYDFADENVIYTIVKAMVEGRDLYNDSIKRFI